MADLNLDKYTDRQLVHAILNLPSGKFMSVMNAIGAISERMQRRGRLIARDSSDVELEEMIRRLFTGEADEQE